MRLKIIRLIITGCFLMLAWVLISMQVVRGNYFYALSKNNRIRVVENEARRGRIFDRNGLILADNRLSFEVMVVAQEVVNNDALFTFLSQILETDKMELWRSYKRRMVNTFTPVLVASDISLEKMITLEENKSRFPGLTIRVGSKRYYPYHYVGAHALGYVGKVSQSEIKELKNYGYAVQKLIGKAGIEEYYDTYLKGEPGGLQIEVNNRGRQVRLISYKEPIKGQDITLTLDNRVQAIAADLLQGRRGAVVVMDLEKSEILGLVSSPTFDPNFFIEGDPQVSEFFADVEAPLLNRAVNAQFPPGSVFKVIMAICGLENNKIRPQTTFDCPGYYALGDREFRCSHVHGHQNLSEALAHSCNVYFFHTGLLLEPLIIQKFARMLGLGTATGIDLPFEARGFVSDGRRPKKGHDRRFSKGDMLNLSIGQGDTLSSPIQLTVMMSILANEGVKIKPHLIKAIGSREVYFETAKAALPFDKENLNVVKSGLRAAVGDYSGTAHALDIPDLSVLGKTGTAQSSRDKPHHAWFSGYIPKAKTPIAFCVFLEYGGSSANACEVGRELVLALQRENIL